MVFSRSVRLEGRSDLEVFKLPCGQCIGCKLEHSRVWAARMMHEAQIHDDNCFITVTYDDDHLPRGGTLVKHHFQDFLKRLRRKIHPQKVRYYMCGEYGSSCPDHGVERCPNCGPIQRPHYHAILFGFDFADKQDLGVRDGYPVYTSASLDSLWSHGSINEIGVVEFESCAYVARYVTKKITGPAAADHYTRHCALTDQIHKLEPEYATMSRNPGIGKWWFEQYALDCFPADVCPIPGRGEFGTPPKYYQHMYEQVEPDVLEQIKEVRRERAEHAQRTGPNLISKLTVKEKQSTMLKRQLS